MNDSLDHKSQIYDALEHFENDLDGLLTRLEQTHPLERKVKFLLDIRGYLHLNSIAGSYIEFGSFQSEMQLAAYKILNDACNIPSYIGLDTFEGEPELSPEEMEFLPVTSKGDFKVSYQSVKDEVKRLTDGKGDVIKGDFREPQFNEMLPQYYPLSLAVVDCNLASSIEASLGYIFSGIADGGVLFVDDYFTNFGKGDPVIPEMVYSAAEAAGKRLIEHSFYAPFAKSFVVVSNAVSS